MSGIRLSKLPERTPIKLALSILPELHQMLAEYARLYQATYGNEEPIQELIPQMLAAFLASDRTFMKAWMARAPEGAQP